MDFGWIQIGFYISVLLLLVKPLGLYMARVYEGQPVFLDKICSPIERLIYKLGRISKEEMNWKNYTVAMLLFNAIGMVFLYILQRIQAHLPLNPQHLSAVSADSSFNTAVSFVTNTNWQGYGGETTMSYLTQMLGLTVQNFVSAATGMAIMAAVIRGFARKNAETIGNFWVDLVRTITHILLPISIVVSLLLVWQGVPQTFKPYQTVSLLQSIKDSDGKPVTEQSLAVGPVASQIAIKQLGTNGGGYFNVNSAHPFENPTPFSNFIEALLILLISAALCYTFGKMVSDTRQGWAILAAMTIMFIGFLVFCYVMEAKPNQLLAKMGIDQMNLGGNMEGKEARFSVAESSLWATATTSASNGSVNSMHDSYLPLAGMIPMLLIQLGEVIYGGVGCGLYGMLAFVIVAVFIAGLMVGRTPEYLGKKIETYEMKMALLLLLITPALVLIFTAIAVVTPGGKANIFNAGPHGFSEVLYGFSSASNNNGSAFAGLGANNPFYNLTLGIAMFLGRFWLGVPILAVAGSLVKKKKAPVSAGTLPTHTPLFICWLIAIVLLVGALNFLPALSLGPVVEHLAISQSQMF